MPGHQHDASVWPRDYSQPNPSTSNRCILCCWKLIEFTRIKAIFHFKYYQISDSKDIISLSSCHHPGQIVLQPFTSSIRDERSTSPSAITPGHPQVNRWRHETGRNYIFHTKIFHFNIFSDPPCLCWSEPDWAWLVVEGRAYQNSICHLSNWCQLGLRSDSSHWVQWRT